MWSRQHRRRETQRRRAQRNKYRRTRIERYTRHLRRAPHHEQHQGLCVRLCDIWRGTLNGASRHAFTAKYARNSRHYSLEIKSRGLIRYVRSAHNAGHRIYSLHKGFRPREIGKSYGGAPKAHRDRSRINVSIIKSIANQRWPCRCMALNIDPA